MSTETIDLLFLELSQFTQATTAKELALIVERDAVVMRCGQLEAQAVMLTAERDALRAQLREVRLQIQNAQSALSWGGTQSAAIDLAAALAATAPKEAPDVQ